MKKLIIICAIAALATAGTVKAALVAHWAGDDGSGTVLTDSSGNGNNGTLFNGAGFTPDRVVGPYALEFNSVNVNADDYASVGTAGVSISGDFSFTLWVKPEYEPGNVWYNWARLIGETEPVNGQGYSVEWANQGPGPSALYFHQGDGGWYGTIQTTTLFANGTWYHVAGTSDGTNIKLYVNGVLEATLARGPLVDNVDANPLIIGSNPNNARWFEGKLDDISIWNHALTQGDIVSIMNYGIAGFLNIAKNLSPVDGATGVNPDVILTWDDSPLPNHNFDVYFGTDDLSDPNAVPVSTGQTAASYDPSPAGILNYLTTYYWRVDTWDLDAPDPNDPNGAPIPVVWAGPVLSFTTAAQAALNPVPADTATDVLHDQVLSWSNFVGGSENDVYFGTDEAAVTSADRTDITGIYKGQYPGTAYDPFGAGDMAALTTYYWRIDIVTAGGAVVAAGDVWEFTTADVICDPSPVGDINGDCIVDILDFAELASDWLVCNLSPQFLCP